MNIICIILCILIKNNNNLSKNQTEFNHNLIIHVPIMYDMLTDFIEKL